MECVSVLQDVVFYALILQLYKAVALAMPEKNAIGRGQGFAVGHVLVFYNCL